MTILLLLGATLPGLRAQETIPKDFHMPTVFKSDPNNPRIAYATAMLLGQYQYLQHPMDTEIASRFFDEYINSLDPRHENFLRSDLDQFNIYRTNLDVLTTGGRGVSDLTPAYAIYQRYLLRTAQHTDYVKKLLHQGDFDFSAQETIEVDRRHSPFPANLDEAKALWKQRLRYEYLQEKLPEEITETNGEVLVHLKSGLDTNIIETLTRRYQWLQHMTTNTDGDAILQTYLEALAHAYDPHSDYFSAPHAQDFSIDMSLSLFGIGAQLQEDYGFCTIKELIPGGPAAKSKQVNPEDRIIAVAQGDKPPVDVVDMDLEKVVQLIRGPKNTEVRLTISPVTDRSSRHVITLIRDEIKLDNMEAKAQLIVEPNGRRLGVLDVPSFYAPVGSQGGQSYVSSDVAKLIRRLKAEKVDGIIMDLRSNPGGSLEEAVRLTGLFIKDGPVVLARDADGQVAVDSDPDSSIDYDGPLVVMINRFSASASEIAAAALQDYGRALIVGDTSTHGKGTVQSLTALRPYVWPATPTATNDPGTLKITKGKFYRITGASTQLKGVASDIVLPDILDHSPFVGESSLDYPLPWDTIDPVEFNHLDRVKPYLAKLKALSETRVSTNQDFDYIREDIVEYEKMHEDREATINETEAIQERKQAIKQAYARMMEREARPAPLEKIYELTVENAQNPELPAPLSFYSTNVITTAYNGVPALIYCQNGSRMLPVPGKGAVVSVSGTNIVAHWAHPAMADLPAGLSQSPGVILDSHGLSITNPIELDRNVPDAYLDETLKILQDYISLSKDQSLQIASH